jgi:hypothetical protein
MWTYCIDISGSCNLSCPSCPSRGYSFGLDGPTLRPPARLMQIDMFKAILEKVAVENPTGDVEVCLYVWGEPLLHNKIGEMIRLVRARGWQCVIATNLNASKHLSDMVAAGPTGVSLSCSGFSGDTYNVTHADGDSNLFISNMFLLRHLMDRHKKEFYVGIHYHLYRTNTHELPDLVRYAKQLRFNFGIVPAYLTTLEEVEGVLAEVDVPLSVQGALDRMLFSPQELKAASQSLENRCSQLENRITIMSDGSVLQCCGVSDPKYTVANSYLETPRDELQARRHSAQVCTGCFETGLPMWYEALDKTPEFRLRIERAIGNRLAGPSTRELVKAAMRSVPAIWKAKEMLRGRY